MLNNCLIQFTNLINESQTLLSVSVFETAKFVHNFVRVCAHIFKYIRLDFELLAHIIHLCLNVFILIFKLIV